MTTATIEQTKVGDIITLDDGTEFKVDRRYYVPFPGFYQLVTEDGTTYNFGKGQELDVFRPCGNLDHLVEFCDAPEHLAPGGRRPA